VIRPTDLDRFTVISYGTKHISRPFAEGPMWLSDAPHSAILAKSVASPRVELDRAT
jgi:hypothetical protein